VWKGIPTERQYPYLAAKMTQGMPQTKGICSASPLVKDTVINGKFTNTNANLSNTEMKNLLSYAPIAVTLYVPPSFFDYSGGTYSGCPNFTTSVHNINHGVLIVGYDVNGNYVIKNSWGTSWGKNGFALISKDADCGMSHAPRYIRGNNLPLEYDPNQ
jgi:cathepsin L